MIPGRLIDEVTSLREAGHFIEITEEDQRVFLVFRGYKVSDEIFNVSKTNLMVWTSKSYPMSHFDMFWTEPNLTLKNGQVPHAAATIQSYLGTSWRMFSIHPYNHKPWNPVVDSLKHYLLYVEQRLNENR